MRVQLVAEKIGGEVTKESKVKNICDNYSLVFAKNTSVSRKFGENSSKISAGGGILGKDERV